MLDYCLLHSGWKKIMLYKLSVNTNTTNSAFISVLGEDEDDPVVGADIMKVTSCIWQQDRPDVTNGVFDVFHGVVVQDVFEWPFEKCLNEKHIDLIQTCVGNKGTPCCRMTITGFYQNLGPHSTSQWNRSRKCFDVSLMDLAFFRMTFSGISGSPVIVDAVCTTPFDGSAESERVVVVATSDA